MKDKLCCNNICILCKDYKTYINCHNCYIGDPENVLDDIELWKNFKFDKCHMAECIFEKCKYYYKNEDQTNDKTKSIN